MNIKKTNKKESKEKMIKDNNENKKKKVLVLLKAVVILVLIIIIAIAGLLIGNKIKYKETIIDFGFKDVGQLVTQEWYGRILQDSSKDRKLFNVISIPLTRSRIIFSLDVEVTAGIDFNQIEYELKEDNTLKIKLPKSQIYKYYQKPNTFNSYLDNESWFTNINSEERHKLEDAVVEVGKQKAIESGLLEKADKNAKVIIEQMVKSKNKNIKIDWKYKE